MGIKKTRTAALIATAAVGALALAGCSAPANSNSSASGAGKTITVYVGANTQYAQAQQQWFKDVSAAFEKQTGAKVAFETYASGNDELTKIQTSVVSNQGPDIYDLGTTFTPTAYSTGAFVKLTAADWKAIGGKSKFIPSTLGISGPDANDQVGIPFASRPFVMAYNTDLLTKAGISAPATTWDGLAEQAKKLTGNGVYGMAVAYKDNYDPWKYVWAMDRQSGNPMVSGKTAKLDDPATLKAYQTYFGWLTKDHVVDPASVGWSNNQALAAFASGKAAFFPMTTATSIHTLDSSAVKGKYKYALMPTVPPGATSLPSGGTPVASILSGDNLVVAQYSKTQDLDFKLIKLLTDDAQQKIQYADFGNLPVNASTASALESSSPALKPIVDASAASYATPFTGAWGDIELALVNVVVQSIPKLASGSVSDSSLKSLLTAAQKTAQSSLNRAK
jgi:ABC-type sugar transport system, periplasmic component